MTQIDKLDRLLKSDQKLFHTQDLALLWAVENRNTLYTAIKRFVKKGVLIKVRKGLYSVLPLGQIDPLRLGLSLIHRFCYLSCEAVLAKAGIVFQKVYPLTFVSSVSQKIKLRDSLFIYRRLANRYLLNPEGVRKENGYFVASKERAVADLFYFNPRYFLDNPDLIDWEKVKEIQSKVGYKHDVN